MWNKQLTRLDLPALLVQCCAGCMVHGEKADIKIGTGCSMYS
jgi:hypothetical protein